MRDLDSPIACTSLWSPLSSRMSKHRVLVRDSRLSKFRAGYKQSEPYLDNSVLDREDVFDFMCVIPPTVR
jgi:hypothetical protein